MVGIPGMGTGWQRTFDPLRDAFNHEHGWSRADDPARARAQRPGHVAYIEASKLRAGLEHEPDPRTLIRDYLVQRVEHGTPEAGDRRTTRAGLPLKSWPSSRSTACP